MFSEFDELLSVCLIYKNAVSYLINSNYIFKEIILVD